MDCFDKYFAYEFIKESLSIESIFRDPLPEEFDEYFRFMRLREITVGELEHFVSIYQPDAKLRERHGMNVRIGNAQPLAGGEAVRRELAYLLHDAQTLDDDRLPPNAWTVHCRYEVLHPFMDCNGRSGRMLWLWLARDGRHTFLQSFYYQTLQNFREKGK